MHRARARAGFQQPISNFSPHERLGVSEDADSKEIKRAFRRMALKHHPDREGGSEANFLLVIEAYEILTGKRDGKETSSSDKGSWDYHDWFWKFAMNRRHKGSSPASKDEAFASQSQMQTQLAGLRHRAAIRSIKKKQDVDQNQQQASVHSTECHEGPVPHTVTSNESPSGGVMGHDGDFVDCSEGPADSGVVQESEEGVEARLGRAREEARRRAALEGSEAKASLRGQLHGLKRKAKLRKRVAQEV